MGTNRDNFSEETKRIAAGRVGYRCSFPKCPNATIGASMENPKKTSRTGVAAHICAAAEGGPRYDKNMTEAERKSVENCIWLCQTHTQNLSYLNPDDILGKIARTIFLTRNPSFIQDCLNTMVLSFRAKTEAQDDSTEI